MYNDEDRALVLCRVSDYVSKYTIYFYSSTKQDPQQYEVGLLEFKPLGPGPFTCKIKFKPRHLWYS